MAHFEEELLEKFAVYKCKKCKAQLFLTRDVKKRESNEFMHVLLRNLLNWKVTTRCEHHAKMACSDCDQEIGVIEYVDHPKLVSIKKKCVTVQPRSNFQMNDFDADSLMQQPVIKCMNCKTPLFLACAMTVPLYHGEQRIHVCTNGLKNYRLDDRFNGIFCSGCDEKLGYRWDTLQTSTVFKECVTVPARAFTILEKFEPDLLKESPVFKCKLCKAQLFLEKDIIEVDRSSIGIFSKIRIIVRCDALKNCKPSAGSRYLVYWCRCGKRMGEKDDGSSDRVKMIGFNISVPRNAVALEK